MEQCIFCKIIAGELPSSKVYEDEQVVAFLDIHPVRSGHTLVVPKVHCQDFLDCDPQVGADLMKAAQKVAKAVIKGTSADGVNLGINNGRAAGQVIFHLHMHIIPRKESDGLRLWSSREYAPGEKEALAEKISAQL